MRRIPHSIGTFSLVLAITAGLPAQKGDPRLAEAKQLFGSHLEQNHWKGGKICVEVNNVAAVELLLGLLNNDRRLPPPFLAPGHYRDIAWESLKQIKDPYARKRVELELRKNRKNAFQRQWCAHALGHYGDQVFGPSLQKALKDRDLGVRRWAARSLGWLRFAPAAPNLEKLVKHKFVYLRANAIEALARIDNAKYKDTFVNAMHEDRDGGLRCALLGAAAEIYPTDVEAWCMKRLADEDWRPRMQAVDNLRKIRTKGAIDGLVRATTDGRPVVSARAIRYLQEVTEQPIRSAQVWAKWWKDNRSTFKFPDAKKGKSKKQAPRTVVYNDIPLESNHAAFLIDRSYAVKAPLKEKRASKESAAFVELDRVLTKLRGKMIFNLFGYHEEVLTFAKKPAKLTAKNQKKAMKFIRGIRLGRSKDIWQLLEKAIQDPTLDTAYLLSSGEPDIGTYVHSNRVTDHLSDMNRFHKVVVHAIAYSDVKGYRQQLEHIAKVTGGEFRAFQ